MRLRFLLLACPWFCLAAAQDTLSIEDALRLARRNNGTIRAAELNVRAADSSVRQSVSAFLPTVTPSYQYLSQRQEFAANAATQTIQTEGGSSQINANWRILDAGQRDLSLRASRRGLESQVFSARQTLRETLYTVYKQYYDTLRAQELQRVADVQVQRTATILEQTKARVEAKDAARKDILQAQADALNAQVDALRARNRTTNAAADLKAVLGIPTGESLPSLVRPSEPTAYEVQPPLTDLVASGIDRRADLAARRRNIESQNLSVRRLRREAGLTWSVDGRIGQQLTPNSLNDRSLQFNLSYPLFDGGLLRENARRSEYLLQADQESLVQAERQVRAEIESAYAEYTQNNERLRAAQSALDAARVNFEATTEAQRLSAATLIEVLTAQVSLVTAESNFIEATYDFTISSARLRLVTGQAVPGE